MWRTGYSYRRSRECDYWYKIATGPGCDIRAVGGVGREDQRGQRGFQAYYLLFKLHGIRIWIWARARARLRLDRMREESKGQEARSRKQGARSRKQAHTMHMHTSGDNAAGGCIDGWDARRMAMGGDGWGDGGG